MQIGSPRPPSELPLLEDLDVPANSYDEYPRPTVTRERVKYLWTRVRNVSRILGRLNKMLSDIQLFGASRKEYRRGTMLESGLLPFKSHSSKCVLLPQDCVLKYWSMFMIFLLMYTAIVTPYRVCFVDEVSGTWLGLDIATDVLFAVDICFNFLSAYEENDGTIVTNKWKIAKKYGKSWFLLDVLGCLPINYIQISGQENSNTGDTYNRLIRLLRLPRMYRLLRVFRLMKMLRVFRSNRQIQRLINTLKVNSGVLRLLRFSLTILIIVHISGCFWYFLAKLEEFGPDTWVSRYSYTSLSNSDLYIVSIYYVVTTLTTVGFGDIAAYTVTERIFAVILMGFGVGFYSYTISNLSTIMENIDIRRSNLQTRLSILNDFCKASKLPRQLKVKIKRHLLHNHERNIYSWLSQDTLLKELPAALRTEIAQYMYKDIIEKVAFFQDKDPGFISFILPHLRSVCFKSGEVIFQQNEHADEVYFILTGRVSYKSSQGIIFRVFIQGSYFGEVEILENVSRRYTAIITSKVAELMVMTKETLWSMMEEFPEIALEVIETAKEKRLRMTKSCVKAGEGIGAETPASSSPINPEIRRKYQRRSSINGPTSFGQATHSQFTVKVLRSAEEDREEYWDKLKEKYEKVSPALGLSGGSSYSHGSPKTPGRKQKLSNGFTAQAMPLFSPEAAANLPGFSTDAASAMPTTPSLESLALTLKEKEHLLDEQFQKSARLMQGLVTRQGEIRSLTERIASRMHKIK